MHTLKQIIIIEDSPGDFLLLKKNLAAASMLFTKITHVQSLEELYTLPASTNPDLIFLDLNLPDSRGLETFISVNQFFSTVPVIILSGLDDVELALQAIQEGAQDFLIKGDFEAKILTKSIQHSIERKNNELALRESENRLRTILDTDPDCIKLMNINCEIYEINKAGLAMVEADSFEAIKGASLLQVAASPYDEMLSNMIKDAFNGIEGQVQFEMITLKGNRRWCEINIVPYCNALGTIIWALGVTRDITNRKADEEKLKRSSERFLMITSTTNDAVWEWDLETGELWSNENHQHLYGLTINDPVPAVDVWNQKLHPDDRENIIKKQEDTLASSDNVFISEYRFKKMNGDYMNIYDRTYILRNATGKPIRMTGSMMDITERKKAEQELKESYGAIRELTSYLEKIREEERTNISREIHDELGQQLTVLKMDISWLNKKIKHLADASVLQRVDGMLSMLNETVNSVRRISSNLRPSLLDDLGLVVALEWQLSEFEKRSGIKTVFTADEIGTEINRDIATGLFRIFQESLTNAAKHADATEVTVSLQKINDHLILHIRDNGVGYENEAVKNKKTFGILGMQERSLMMGGEYRIRSETGAGTSVEVTVPLTS